MAKQFAQSKNADVAFTAYCLVLNDSGRVLRVPEDLYDPIDQAAIVSSSRKQVLAKRFTTYLTGTKGRTLLQKFGYSFPPK